MTKEAAEKYIRSKMCKNCSVYLGGGKCSDNCKVIEAIKVLEQEPCDTCGYEEGSIYCKEHCPYEAKIEQESSGDTISRQAVLDLLADYDLSMGQVVRGIHALPPVTPQPKTGHWIFDDECKEHGHCSQCGYGSVDLVDGESHNFCRNCGAKMIEPQERSDKE